jgi:hypothetical protein
MLWLSWVWRAGCVPLHAAESDEIRRYCVLSELVVPSYVVCSSWDAFVGECLPFCPLVEGLEEPIGCEPGPLKLLSPSSADDDFKVALQLGGDDWEGGRADGREPAWL